MTNVTRLDTCTHTTHIYRKYSLKQFQSNYLLEDVLDASIAMLVQFASIVTA